MPQNLGRRSFCVDEQLEVLGEGDAWRGQGSSFLTPCPVHFFLLAVSELSVQSVTQLCPTLCALWIAACQAFLSITNSCSLFKLMSIESVMPSNHLILCRPLLLLPSIFPSIRIFSKESVLHVRWSKYWTSSFKLRPSNEHSGLISLRMD